MYLIAKLRFGSLFNFFPQHKAKFCGNFGDPPNSAFAV